MTSEEQAELQRLSAQQAHMNALAAGQQQAFNRAADLNVTQIMDRIGSLEKAVNSMQNHITQSVVLQVGQHVRDILNHQQDQAANEAEHEARIERLENEAIRKHYERQTSDAGRSWTLGLLVLILIALLAALYFGGHLIGG